MRLIERFLPLVLALLLTQAAFAEIEITPDLVYGHKDGMALTMDVYQPEDSNGVGVLFMVSGGWYSKWQPPEQAQGFIQPLLDKKFTVFAVRHGSSPKYTIPEIVKDVRRSVRFIKSRAKELEVDPDRLGVSGGSAGGHLSLVLAATGDDGDKDAKDEVLRYSSRVAAAVAYFPPTDLRPYVKEDSLYRKNYPALQFEQEKAGEYSPLIHASSDDPPCLMIHGDKDRLVPIWHSEKMVAAFEANQVKAELIVIKDAAHGFGGADAKRASDAWVAWFEQYLVNAQVKTDLNDSNATDAINGGVNIPAGISASVAIVLDNNTNEKRNADEKRNLEQKSTRVHTQQVLLWPAGAPFAEGNAPIDQPALTIHLPEKENANGSAVIVNPGGGYHVLASDHEGLQIARELNRQGTAAFVLRYRLKPKYQPVVALLDGQRAVRYVRHHAEQYGIDANRIGMLGFSAGGHLASAVGTNFDAGKADAADPIDRQSCRPDFLVLIYPAILGREILKGSSSTDQMVTKDTPPTFFAHSHEDFLSPNHSIAFYQALLKEKIPAELHVFGYGPHGTGAAPGDPDFGKWTGLMQSWMKRSGWLTSERRVAVTGNVSIDDEPLYWGWLTLIPMNENQPPAAAYMDFNRKGKFSIDEKHGVCLGKYRVEVQLVSSDFSDQHTGAYSIDDAVAYRTDPNGEPMVIELTEENRSNLEIKISTK